LTTDRDSLRDGSQCPGPVAETGLLALTIHSDLAGVRGGTEKGAPDL
jgi:hypothetical protein